MLDFPSSPTIGQTYPVPPVDGTPVYVWDGEKWTLLIEDEGGGGGGSQVIISDTPPVGVPPNSLWYETDTGNTYVRYADPNTTQWVMMASPFGGAGGGGDGADIFPGSLSPKMNGVASAGIANNYSREDHVHPTDTSRLALSGGTVTGTLNLPAANPTGATQAAHKAYVDTKISLAGGTMTGALFLNADPVGALGATTKQYSDNQFNWLNGNKVAKGGDSMTGGLWATYLESGGDIRAAGNITGAGVWSLGATGVFGLTGDANWRRLTFQPDWAFQWSSYNGDLFWSTPYGNHSYWRGGDLHLSQSGQCSKPGGGVWADNSDIRIKTVLGDYENGLDAVNALRPVRYVFKGNDTPQAPEGKPKPLPEGSSSDAAREREPAAVPYFNSMHKMAAEKRTEFVGLVAQDAKAAMPELVSLEKGFIDGKEVHDLHCLDTTPLIYALVNAVKELTARIEALERR